MPTMTRTPAPTRRPHTTSPPTLAATPAGTLSDAVSAACATVADLHPSDPRWVEVGPRLTAFVDAARRAVEGSGSCIGAGEVVPAVLRLRELSRLSLAVMASHAVASAEVAGRLRSLQTATVQ